MHVLRRVAAGIAEEKALVDQNEDFVAFCPFGSRWSYELWVAPVRHSSSSRSIMTEPGRVAALAPFLKSCLQRIEKVSQSLHWSSTLSPICRRGSPPKSGGKPCGMIITGTLKFNRTLRGGGAFWAPRDFISTPFPAEQAALVLRALEPGSGAARPQLNYGQPCDFRLETSSPVGL